MTEEQRPGDTRGRLRQRLDAVVWFIMVVASSVAATILIITDGKK